MTKYRLGWAAGILICTLCCLFTDNYQCLYIIMCILLFLLCSVFVAALDTGIPAVHFNIAENSRKSQEFYGTLTLKKSSAITLFKAQIDLTAENLMTGEKTSYQLMTGIKCKGESQIPFVMKSEFCGCIQVTVNKITLYDVTGIWKKVFAIDESAETVILPDTFVTDIHMVPGMLADNESIEYSNEKPGDDMSEIFGIREYMPGDNIRNIHWKLTGKCDELMVRLPSLPMENSVLLLMETSGELSGQDNEKAAAVYDAMAEIFITMSQNLLQNDITHEIAWYDHRDSILISLSIEREDDLLGALKKLLSCSHDADETKAYHHYVREHGQVGKAHLVYVAQEYNTEIESLSDEIVKTAITCNYSGQTAEQGSLSYTCTPDNYTQVLQYIHI